MNQLDRRTAGKPLVQLPRECFMSPPGSMSGYDAFKAKARAEHFHPEYGFTEPPGILGIRTTPRWCTQYDRPGIDAQDGPPSSYHGPDFGHSGAMPSSRRSVSGPHAGGPPGYPMMGPSSQRGSMHHGDAGLMRGHAPMAGGYPMGTGPPVGGSRQPSGAFPGGPPPGGPIGGRPPRSGSRRHDGPFPDGHTSMRGSHHPAGSFRGGLPGGGPMGGPAPLGGGSRRPTRDGRSAVAPKPVGPSAGAPMGESSAVGGSRRPSRGGHTAVPSKAGGRADDAMARRRTGEAASRLKDLAERL